MGLGIIRRSAELFEEREQGVGRLVAAWGGVDRGGPGQGPFLDGLVGVQVDLGRLGAFVSEPEWPCGPG